jgi:C4-dicarboxylate-binding protein DctP
MNTTLKLGIAAIATVLSGGSALAADYTMRLSHQLPPTHHVAKALEQFAADVKANTGGKVEVQIFGSEQLFKASQNHAAVARGQVEAASIVSVSWGSTIPEINVVSIPYLMTRVDQLQKFPSSDAARLLNEKIQEKGVRNIGWLVDANDAVITSSKAPLVAPADYKGVKIRGLNKLFDNGLAAMGASPSAMPGSEVYQALQTGVLDAGLSSASAVNARRYYEVQKFGSAAPMLTVYQTLVVNPDWWSKLPGDARQAIETAVDAAQARLLPKTDEVAPDDIARLRERGMTITVLSPEQNKALEAVMQPPVVKAFADTGADAKKLLELVRGL